MKKLSTDALVQHLPITELLTWWWRFSVLSTKSSIFSPLSRTCIKFQTCQYILTECPRLWNI